MVHVIDSDQHLFEPRDLWQRYCDPSRHEDALSIVDDALGHPWLSWRGKNLGLADVPLPPQARCNSITSQDRNPAGGRVTAEVV